MKKNLCIMLVLALVLSSTSLIFADPGKQSMGNGKEKNAATQSIDKELIKSVKQALTEEKAAMEAVKDQLEEQKDKLEADIEAALAAGNAELAAQLKVEFDAVVVQFTDAKGELKAIQAERKQVVHGEYTEEELTALKEAAANITAADPTATVLEVSEVISDDIDFKFDTPPVIKGNRTLIPVRAITEGLGAQVSWDPATEQVTIVKDQTTIVLTLGNNVALVNGQEVTLDTKANTMNNRTYVPMRFIMETFNLQVTYDEGTIEVEDPSADTTTDTITEAAITTDAAIQ